MPAENIILGNGAAEIIFILARLLNLKEALIPAPTFSEYEIATAGCGSRVRYFDLDRKQGFRPDADKLAHSLPGADIVFVCNPNNPTGCLMEAGDVMKIVRAGQKTNTLVVVDEAFLDFLPDKDRYSVVHEVVQNPNLFVLYSLTKFFAVPGLRLGAAIGSREIIERLDRAKDPWNVNTLAQAAGTASLMDKEYIRRTVDFISGEKEFLYQALSRVDGLRPYPPAANYILVDISGTGYTSGELRDILGRQGILIRDCSSYRNLGENYIRVAVRNREDNIKLIKAMQAGIGD